MKFTPWMTWLTMKAVRAARGTSSARMVPRQMRPAASPPFPRKCRVNHLCKPWKAPASTAARKKASKKGEMTSNTRATDRRMSPRKTRWAPCVVAMAERWWLSLGGR
jgi:hypothetical protein